MLTSLDGRYAKQVDELTQRLSEKALFSRRIQVEVAYLIALSEKESVPLREFTPEEKEALFLLQDLSEEGYQQIKLIEKETNHDVKAVERYLRERVPPDTTEWVHFALTSEDVNNLAFSLMFTSALKEVLIPRLEELIDAIENISTQNKDTPMLARTHGQAASPTTFSHEMRVFSHRLRLQLSHLQDMKLQGKLAGATGGWNAHYVALPDTDWREFSRELIQSLGFAHNPTVTQIESHDSWIEILHALQRVCGIVIDFDQDMWRYVSDGWLIQKKVEGEVGSSAMPHKVNPIQFENSEGNARMAVAVMEGLCRTLPISRLQRDLSDSTVTRNVAVAFGHTLLTLGSAKKGVGRVAVDEEKMLSALNAHPEVLAEAVQTVLRVEGYDAPYELLRKWTQGEHVSLEKLHELIDSLEVEQHVREKLKQLRPHTYIGVRS